MNHSSESLAKLSLFLALCLSLLGTALFWGSWIGVIGSWLALVPMALLIALVFGFVLNAMGVTQDGEKTTPSLWVDDDKINITERGPVLGRIYGNEFFEFVILKRPDNGELVRCEYDSIVDMERGFAPPNNRWFIMSEGALYIQPESTLSVPATE